MAAFVALVTVSQLIAAAAGEPKEASGTESKETGGARQITNSIGMKLTLIPSGEFTMGSGESAEATAALFKEKYQMGGLKADYFKSEHPQHRVRVTRPFYFGTYHVTRGQFRKFVEATGYKTFVERGEGFEPGAFGFDTTKNMYGFLKNCSWQSPGYEQTDEHPVVMIEWIDAVAFCDWLSKKEGKRYRLPTEAEWEYACRAGTTTRYHSGDDPETLATVANVGDAAAAAKFGKFPWAIKASDGYVFTSPVGRFKPNAFGLYDMHGNAWQWCSDWYKADYYVESLKDDPTGPGVGYRNRLNRVLRGGSWYSRPWECYSASRRWLGPVSRECDQAGFRVALCVDPSDDPVKRSASTPPIAKGAKVLIERIANGRYIGSDNNYYVAIQLKVTGPDMAEVKSLRTLVQEATDDAGNPLPLPDGNDQFKSPLANEFWLRAPRLVKTVKSLRGEVDLMLPGRDPESVITASVATEAGVPLKRAALKAAIVEITLNKLQGPPENDRIASKDWSLSYLLNDPYGKIIGNPEFLDHDGRKLVLSNGPYGGGSGGLMALTVLFKSTPPQDLQVRFYVATDKTIVAVPFDFKDVPVEQSPR
jgi:formylglycine-generating enzyme required for sulfatase activity